MAVLVSRRSKHAGARGSYRWLAYHRLRSLVPQRVGLDLFYGRLQAHLRLQEIRRVHRGMCPAHFRKDSSTRAFIHPMACFLGAVTEHAYGLGYH
jgi:hypothetical protein